MRHLRYFLFFSGMLFLLTGCRPDYEQALDNMQATQRLVSAVVHPNYDAIQEAATEGANMNRIWGKWSIYKPNPMRMADNPSSIVSGTDAEKRERCELCGPERQHPADVCVGL